MKIPTLPAVAFCAGLAATGARAHVTLEGKEAPVGSYYKAVMRVPHGCDGAATVKLRVQIPEGVIAVKPMPKPDWRIETARTAYKQAYQLHGRPLAEGIREVSWAGRLADEFYDEFVFQAYLTNGLQPGTVLYFPVVQECEGGKVHRWIEIPAPGKSAGDYKEPAPGLRLTPGSATN